MPTDVNETRKLLDVHAVAAMLSCSWRSIYRLSDMGKMPRPVKINGMVRWSADSIYEWIRQGCPDCKKTGWTPPVDGAATATGKGVPHA